MILTISGQRHFLSQSGIVTTCYAVTDGHGHGQGQGHESESMQQLTIASGNFEGKRPAVRVGIITTNALQ